MTDDSSRSEFLQLPFQAVECGLHGIKPKGNAYWENFS